MSRTLPVAACLVVLFAAAAFGLDCAPCQPSACGHPAAIPSPALQTLPADWQTRLYQQLMAGIDYNKWGKYKHAILDDPVPCRVTVTTPGGLFRSRKRETYSGYVGFVATRSQGFLFRKSAYHHLYVMDAQGGLLRKISGGWGNVDTYPKLFDVEIDYTYDSYTTYETDPFTGVSMPKVEVVVHEVEVLNPYMNEQSRAKLRRLNQAKFEELPALM